MVNFTRAFTALVVILAIHIFAIVSGWYEHNLWFDNPMHFSGGAAIAYLGLASWNATIQKVTLQKSLNPVWHTVVYAVGILGFVALVGIAWEWYEFIFDTIITHYHYDALRAQMGLGDTMVDLFLDVLGGLTAFTVFRNRSQD